MTYQPRDSRATIDPAPDEQPRQKPSSRPVGIVCDGEYLVGWFDDHWRWTRNYKEAGRWPHRYATQHLIDYFPGAEIFEGEL